MAKDALTWFSNLPAESIDNFDGLTNAFLKHYSMHMTRVTQNMFTTTQAQGEPLRSFMERFKQEARDTGDMPDSVLLEALRNGLWRTAPSKPREEAVEVQRRHDPKRSLLTAFVAADDESEQESQYAATISTPQDAAPLGDDNDIKAF
ncbi:unnamed protein product [Microthlaspi erraticum]|uniref:Retrotransposon gag domain-containing protein n=1 Tax=Microthlaspi erraticum TaxID=1685480 RepID=A0A6D2JXF6_9BRAS|nr:unnamed protein product [Microthlaspi erraticum]